MNPLVTIIIPVFNGSNYVGIAIESALSQDYPNIEVLVINDGSTDNGATKEICTQYQSRIRYYEKENGGVASALNLGLREMNGTYFSWLSHDDRFLSNKISQQVDFAVRNDARFVYSNAQTIDQVGNLIDDTSTSNTSKWNNLLFELFADYPINGCATLIHKEIIDEVGFFDEDLETTQDYDYWFRIIGKYKMHYLDMEVTQYRIHPNQDTHQKPWRAKECDALYLKYATQFIPEELASGRLTFQQLRKIIISMIQRGYSGTYHYLMNLNRNNFDKILIESYLFFLRVRRIPSRLLRN